MFTGILEAGRLVSQKAWSISFLGVKSSLKSRGCFFGGKEFCLVKNQQQQRKKRKGLANVFFH